MQCTNLQAKNKGKKPSPEWYLFCDLTVQSTATFMEEMPLSQPELVFMVNLAERQI